MCGDDVREAGRPGRLPVDVSILLESRQLGWQQSSATPTV